MYYHIRVQGHLDATWAAWFDPLTITNAANGEAVLAGELPDQSALHGVLIKIRDLGLPLIAVHPVAAPVSARRDGEPQSTPASETPVALHKADALNR
jgi:hypothetical protein